MSDEIKSAQKQATELGIYEMLQNLATKGKDKAVFYETTWEGCQIKFRETMQPFAEKRAVATSIVMPDGLILFRCEESVSDGTKNITDFRYGAWVERIKAYSEQETVKSFSGVDF
jgi:hypothetical protein